MGDHPMNGNNHSGKNGDWSRAPLSVASAKFTAMEQMASLVSRPRRRWVRRVGQALGLLTTPR
jgi:hypothetical protein